MKSHIGILFFASIALFSGCASSNYQQYARSNADQTLYRSTNQRETLRNVTTTIKDILKPFEEQAQAKIQNSMVQAQRMPMPTNDIQYAFYSMSQMAIEASRWNGMARLADARERAVAHLQPIVMAIYDKQDAPLKAPLTAADVLNNFTDKIPFLGTIGGMYGLGVAAIDKVGDKISVSMRDGDNNVGNGTQGNAGGNTAVGSDNNPISGQHSVNSNSRNASGQSTYSPAETNVNGNLEELAEEPEEEIEEEIDGETESVEETE